MPVIRHRCHVICLRVALCHVIICISYHVIMCISFCIRVRLMHPSIFPVVRFAIRHSYVLRRSRNGPSLAKWPWYTTGRPPVKFRAIWSPFDTPTVNRGTVKSSCVLQPNTPPKWPNNPSKPPPSSRPFDHDRVVENRTSFGHSHLLLPINMCTPPKIRVPKP